MRLRGKLIKKNHEFVQVYRQGKVAAGRYCVLYFLLKEDNNTRVGISVSKKVGNSVVRHRMKRLYKEAFHQNYHGIKTGYDLVVIVRKKAFSIGFKECQADFLYTLKKAGVTLTSKEQG